MQAILIAFQHNCEQVLDLKARTGRKRVLYQFRSDSLLMKLIGYIITDLGVPVQVKIESGLPWNGKVKIHVRPGIQKEFKINFRKPSWASAPLQEQTTACGYDPRAAEYETILRAWHPGGETLEFNFDMAVQLRRAHPKVKGHADKVALTRGPLVYCLESVDNPAVDIFSVQLDPASLHAEFVADLFGGCVVIHGKTTDDKALKFIPYFLWANRGASQMTVWVNST